MPEVLIRNCRLRVVRKGGWTWGQDRRQLVSMATQALPRLIAEALSHLLKDVSGDVSIPKLSIRLGPRAADVLRNRRGAGSSNARDILRAALVHQLRPQLPDIAAVAIEQPADRAGMTPSPPQMERVDFAQLIVAWYKDRSLQVRLEWFAPAVLQAWENALLAGLPQLLRDDASIAYEPPAAMQTLLAIPRSRNPNLTTLFSLRLLLAADILAANPGQVHARELQRLLDLFLPASRMVADAAETEHDPESDSPPAPEVVPKAASTEDLEFALRLPKRQPWAPPAKRSPVSSLDTRVFSALPFLVLGVLHRMGYLRTLSAALQLSRATPHAASFATALAYKVLRPPEAGWRRDPDSLHAAAVFAGRDAPLEQDALRAFERQIGAQLSTVNADLVAALRAGYDARNPFVLQELNGKHLCFDTNGMFPIAFAAGHGEIESLLRSFRPAVVFMDAATITPTLTECLERNSCTFITDAQPGRGDRWHALDPQRRRWTLASHPAPRALIESYLHAREESLEFIDYFIHKRPVIAGAQAARAAEASLENSVTLAAGVALAQLAYTLWHEREPTGAVLAFQRFHDLEARVRFDEERILVRLAVGRRFFDLRDHGLLRDITAVPWWDGRTLVFAES